MLVSGKYMFVRGRSRFVGGGNRRDEKGVSFVRRENRWDEKGVSGGGGGNK
jgi:hypothetical protein